MGWFGFGNSNKTYDNAEEVVADAEKEVSAQQGTDIFEKTKLKMSPEDKEALNTQGASQEELNTQEGK